MVFDRLLFGQKVWIIVQEEYARALRQRLELGDSETSNVPGRAPFKTTYFPTCTLDKWAIPYITMLQNPGETIAVFPGSFCQGFSTKASFSVSEAVKSDKESHSAEADGSTQPYSRPPPSNPEVRVEDRNVLEGNSNACDARGRRQYSIGDHGISIQDTSPEVGHYQAPAVCHDYASHNDIPSSLERERSQDHREHGLEEGSGEDGGEGAREAEGNEGPGEEEQQQLVRGQSLKRSSQNSLRNRKRSSNLFRQHKMSGIRQLRREAGAARHKEEHGKSNKNLHSTSPPGLGTESTPPSLARLGTELKVEDTKVRSVFHEFARRSSSRSTETATIMCRLYFAIACPHAFACLGQACSSFRERATCNSFMTPNFGSTLQALDRLDRNLVTTAIIRRCLMARLMEQRIAHEQRYKENRGGVVRSRKAYGRPDALALADLMSDAYPTLKPTRASYVSTEDEYQKKLKNMKDKLRHASVWYRLRTRFSTGVLALAHIDSIPGLHTSL